MTFMPMLIMAAASAASAYGASKGSNKGPTKTQKSQQKLIDQLLASLQGQGPYSNLFDLDENAFQKSFVDPAKSMFQNQIAPQIQQSYIATGQQQGSGLQDSLTRAGVDLDQMLNQQYYQFQQDALNRKQNIMSNILGAGAGAPNQTSTAQDVMSGLSGYLASPGFAQSVAGMYSNQGGTASGNVGTRRGFVNAQGSAVAGGL